ncbi:MAG: hypothetical protein COA74_12905 [Gammaproteobacteria bacterium]|nr:MAG: hypothetical protein COA74_12905 [Gammaproteobacteria bacterium]
MKQLNFQNKQRGVTLVFAILFLLILTIISVFAASSSSLELKMAGNMQDSLVSFQSAEAGAIATLALAGTPADPFDGATLTQDPFIGFGANHPLANVSGGSDSVTVQLDLTAASLSCPRSVLGFSADLLACDHYNIQSNHDEVQKARSEVHLGAVKTFIGNPVL